MDINSLYLIVIAIVGSAISLVVGFGSALILISASTLFYDVKWSISITTFFFLFNTINKTIAFRNEIDLNLSLKISLLSIPGVLVGVYCLFKLEPKIIYLLLGVISIAYLALDVFKIKPKLEIGDKSIFGAGLAYGFLTGVAGTGSIIKAIVFKHINLHKEVFVATMAATALPLNCIKIVFFVLGGLMVFSDIPIILILLLSSFLGVYLGKKFLAKISQRFFEYLVRIMLFCLSVRLLYMGLI